MNKAAQALGRLAKGVKKTITKADRLRRRKQMESINAKKKRLNGNGVRIPNG